MIGHRYLLQLLALLSILCPSLLLARTPAPPTNSLDASSMFLEAPLYPVGGTDATSVALADVNGDGKPDLIVTNGCPGGTCYSAIVSVLLGNGDGSFQAPVNYSTSAGAAGSTIAWSVAVADVNGDGKPDLVVANSCASVCAATIAVLLGNGDGTFKAAVAYSSGGSSDDAVSVAVADLNGDGKPDVVVANSCNPTICTNSTVGVLLGNGDGTFQAALTYNSGGVDALSVAVGDVNGDGKPDVVVANACATSPCGPNGAVGVLLGNGDGTFRTAPTLTSAGAQPQSVALADVNGDGKLDLLVADPCGVTGTCTNINTGLVGVALGNGDGTFQSIVTYPSGGTDPATSIGHSLAVADVNGDGKPDLLVANDCVSGCPSAGVSVLLGNGDGTFQAAVPYGSGGQNAASLAVGDVNGDGKPDVVVANNCEGNAVCNAVNGGGIGVLLGYGNGTFQAARSYVTAGDVVALADVNGDGKVDLVAGGSGVVSVSLGNGNGTFQSPVNDSLGWAGTSAAYSVSAVDVNGDGKLDLVVAGYCCYFPQNGENAAPSTIVSVLLGNGDGTFQAPVSYTPFGIGALAVVVDVNRDGKPDLVLASSGYANDAVVVMLGNGDGTFQSPVYYAASATPGSVAVADLNGDGKPDIVVANAGCLGAGNTPCGVGVLLGNGDGTFQPVVTYSPNAAGYSTVTLVDVNGDGKLDVVAGVNCASASGNTCLSSGLSVLLGNGDGTFQAAITTNTTPAVPGAIVVADINGDGKPDVSAAGGFLLLGNGDGTFQAPINLGAFISPAPATGDVNGDGKPDLAVGGLILLNIAQRPSVATATSLTSSANPVIVGQAVTFTASVVGQGWIPTGTITFKNGANAMATLPLTNGTAAYTTAFSVVGNQSITAVYSGDGNNLGSTSAVLSEEVLQGWPTTTTLTASANAARVNQSVTFIASLTSQGGGTPTGTVAFQNGANTLATVPLVNGQASYTTSFAMAGTESITAVYSGDASHLPSSTSAAVNVNVTSAVVHFIGAGSGEMYQGFAAAAVNDLANRIASTAPCSTNGSTGITCTVHHWSIKSSQAPANSWAAHDARSAAITDEPGNAWVVWVTCVNGAGPATCPAYTGTSVATDVWAYLALESTVGTREFLGRDANGKPATLVLNAALGNTAGTNVIPSALFVAPWNVADDAGVQADVYAALNGAVVTAGLTDIRPEDALQATVRVLGTCPAGGCNTAGGPLVANTCPSSDTGVPSGNPDPPTPCNNFPYYQSFTLGYGTGAAVEVGTGIVSTWTGRIATPVSFSLPSLADPFSSSIVPGTIQTFPVGESPVIMIANRRNANGLGQIIQSIPACNGLNNNTDSEYCVNDPGNGGPVANGGTGLGWTSDGSYQIRNLWDQHPYPPVNNRFADINYITKNPGSGHCYAAPAAAECKVARRSLGALFGGSLCETVSSAFTWPLDSALEGVRPVLPTPNIAPISLLLRDPLSGTHSTFEYTEVRRFGTPAGNFTWGSASIPAANRWIYTPYLSQEEDIDGSGTLPPAGNTFNPLSLQCQAGYLDPLGQAGEGYRYRGVGTDEIVAGTGTGGTGGVYNVSDSLGYLFFSFEAVNPSVSGANQPMPRNPNYGYLMIDGVDPLFNNYSANGIAALDPGQPAAPGSPLTWGELPNCIAGGGAGVPDCKASAIWDTTHACAGGPVNPNGCTYPHLRDGTYPAWSEQRMMCDDAAANCTMANDPYGAEALVRNVQADIHYNHLGGVPDLLPFSDAATGSLSFNPPYGDVGYIRDHSADLPAGAVLRNGGGPTTLWEYNSFGLADDQQDTYHTISPYVSASNPQTQHKTIPQVQTTCAIGTNSPPNQECGGDVGGFILPAPGNMATSAQGQLQ